MQTIAIGWIFGVNKFCACVEQMTGFLPNMYWVVCWAGIAPGVMGVIFIFYCVQWEPVKYGTVEYPDWAHIIGRLCNFVQFFYLLFFCFRFHNVIFLHDLDPWLCYLLYVHYTGQHQRCEQKFTSPSGN